ncbi:hypothetical protein RRSWK_01293 [Rhodopirellula sp. SWK7]|nr:hypothetical protein RRSWK_01293 [Rhodopirellula sp. SWK7]
MNTRFPTRSFFGPQGRAVANHPPQCHQTGAYQEAYRERSRRLPRPLSTRPSPPSIQPEELDTPNRREVQEIAIDCPAEMTKHKTPALTRKDGVIVIYKRKLRRKRRFE